MVESQPANNPESDLSPFQGTFVGRQRELADLKAALDDAIAGRGRLAMLVGEPGIGKTRTAQELASYAETLSAQVWWGRCYEEEGAPPYWPWLQLLRSYIQRQTPEQLQLEMGSGAADIAEILPELREKLPDLEPPANLEPEQARFRLFNSITTFLRNAAQSQPLMLVLDDLHWADRSSLLLLEFLAREIHSSPLMVLGTYRDVEVSRRHPLSESLGSLIREQPFLRVQLPGLAEPEVEQLIQRASAVNPPPGLSATIHRRTEGNPLFVGEIIRMLPDEGQGESQDYLTHIPEGVRDAIGRRLNRLSEECNQVLTTASVVGREFDFKLLSSLNSEGNEDRVLEAFEEALAARVIEEPPGTVGRYQFTHALIQETLVQELSTTRRARLHARIGQALEELYGAGAEPHAGELAHHFSEAEMILGPEKLVHYSRLAGDQALSTYGWEEAEFHFRRALEGKQISLNSPEPAKDAETAGLLFGLGRAQVGVFPLYRVREAVGTLNRAFTYYDEAGDIDSALAVALCPIIGVGIGRRGGRAQMIERAMKLMPSNFREEGRLLSDYGLALGVQEGDDSGAQAALNRALEIARREGDAPLEMRTLCNAARVDAHQGRPHEALKKSLLALELAPRADDLAAEADAHYQAGNHLITLGDPEAARYHLLATSAPAVRANDYYSTLNILVINIRLSMLAGDWVVARELSDRALAIAPLDARLLLRRIMLEYEEGDFVQGRAYVERLQEVMRITSPGPTLDTVNLAVAVAMAARITDTTEQSEVAKTAADAALSSPYATHSIRMAAACAKAILSVLTGDAVAAAEHHTALKLDSGSVLMDSIVVVDRLLGLLSQTMGKLDEAAQHFEDALAFCRKAGYRPELAWTCCDYAECLIQRNGDGDHYKATSLLDESLALSQELGMPPLMERVTVLKEKTASLPARAPAYPDGLTHREVEVLCLIVAGKTDREIAEELFISARTVGGHISNILNKTSTSNRAEAAVYAARQGLV